MTEFSDGNKKYKNLDQLSHTGSENIEADTLSHLPMTSKNLEVILNHPPTYPRNP